MSKEPTIFLADEGDLSTDARIVFPKNTDTRDNAWLTIDPNRGGPVYSLNIIRTDEGVVFDVYLLDHEDEPTVASTYVFDNEVLEEA